MDETSERSVPRILTLSIMVCDNGIAVFALSMREHVAIALDVSRRGSPARD